MRTHAESIEILLLYATHKILGSRDKLLYLNEGCNNKRYNTGSNAEGWTALRFQVTTLNCKVLEFPVFNYSSFHS